LDIALFHDTDAVLAGFSDLCIQAGPANCSLATEASTGQTILESIRRLIDVINLSYFLAKALILKRIRLYILTIKLVLQILRLSMYEVSSCSTPDMNRKGHLFFLLSEAIFSDLSDPTLWDTDLVPQLLALNKTITSPRSASSTARSPRNSVKRKDLFSGHSKAIDPDLQESLA